jgi:hypothetical protein
MADFKTHITASTVLGVTYGAGGYLLTDTPLATCLLAAGLCSVSGLIPDLDSDSSTPVREGTAFASAVVPMLMLERFKEMGLEGEALVLAAGVIYIIVRFGVAEIFKRYTVHRGMWHSLPAMAICGLLTFLIASGYRLDLRLYKTGAVVAGFFSHLLLDELWSVDLKGRRLKKSAGTAIKLFSDNAWANISTYGKLVVLIGLTAWDPTLFGRLPKHGLPASSVVRDRTATDELPFEAATAQPPIDNREFTASTEISVPR